MLANTMPGTVVLLALAAVQVVNAGSQVWQPRITRYDHLEIPNSEDFMKSGLLPRRMSGNVTAPSHAHQHNKRYLIANKIEAKLWPKNTVRYCFESIDTKNALFDNTKDAINRWWSSGLDQSNFHWDEVSDTDCKNDRANVLLIKRRTSGRGHYASLGFQPADPDNNIDGPEMVIDDGDWGTYDKVATFAHEIGHVFGLQHEHQNPNFWREDQGFKNANAGTAFGTGNFNCKLLSDYQDAVQRVDDEGVSIFVDQLCTSQAFARTFRFSARDYLPFRGDEVLSPPGHGEADVDWDSIMIYASGGLGGSGDHSNLVLTKTDGSYINQPTYPSPLDIVGINTLYSVGPQTTDQLLLDKANPKSSLFKQIYGQANDGGSC